VIERFSLANRQGILLQSGGMALFRGSPARGFLTGQSITFDGGATHP
jgi:hypothetical protein